MWVLYKLAYRSEQDGTVLRKELDLLYPGEDISLLDASSYLVVGYYFNHLSEFRKFVESVTSHA